MSQRLLATALVLMMTLAGGFALTGLVTAEVWLLRSLVVLLVTAGTLLLLRHRVEAIVVPSLVALVIGLLATQALYLSEDTLLGLIPTPSTIDAAATLFEQTIEQIRTSPPPLTYGDGVGMTITLGLLLTFVLTEMLAVPAWAPAWSGIPQLAMWTIPVVIDARAAPVWALLLAGGCWVLLIVTRGHGPRFQERTRRAGAASTVVTVAILAGALTLAPTVATLPVGFSIDPDDPGGGGGGGNGGATRLDLGLDLREDLLRNSDDVLVSYSGAEPDQVGPWHSYTVSNFDGAVWDASEQPVSTAFAEGQVLWPQPLNGTPLGEPTQVDVDIVDLAQDRLLLPGEPRAVSGVPQAQYATATDEVITTAEGRLRYQVGLLPRELTPDLLRALEPPQSVAQTMLAVPQTGYESQIEDLARAVVDAADAQSPYDQVLAIQRYLRDPAEFVYTTQVGDPTTNDAVYDFLNDRRGYCVQFATTMVMMVRSLQIPARLAVGFLPGETAADGRTIITGAQAHAWPQVLLEDVGWVRFEPTPAIQTGEAPAWAPDEIDEQSSPSEPTSAEPSTEPTEADPTSAAPEMDDPALAAGEDHPQSAAGWLWGVLVLLVAAAAACALLMVRRRRRAGTGAARLRWDSLLPRLARRGVDTGPNQTPRAIATAAAGLLEPAAERALMHLVEALERESWADPAAATADEEAQLEEWTRAVTDALRTKAAAH